MSYTPTTWQTGDTITAEKLNNMESGIAEANKFDMLVNATVTVLADASTTISCDKTVNEVETALSFGKNVGMYIIVDESLYTGGRSWKSFAKFLDTDSRPIWYATIEASGAAMLDISDGLKSAVVTIQYGKWELIKEDVSDMSFLMRRSSLYNIGGKFFGCAPRDNALGWQNVNETYDMYDAFSQLIEAALLQAQGGKATLTTQLDTDTAEIVYGMCDNTIGYFGAGRGVTLNYAFNGTYASAVAISASKKNIGVEEYDLSSAFSGRLAFSFTSSTAESYDITFEFMTHYDHETITAIFSVTAEQISHTFIS